MADDDSGAQLIKELNARIKALEAERSGFEKKALAAQARFEKDLKATAAERDALKKSLGDLQWGHEVKTVAPTLPGKLASILRQDYESLQLAEGAERPSVTEFIAQQMAEDPEWAVLLDGHVSVGEDGKVAAPKGKPKAPPTGPPPVIPTWTNGSDRRPFIPGETLSTAIQNPEAARQWYEEQMKREKSPAGGQPT